MRYIDLHCDSLFKCQEYGLHQIIRQPELMVDIDRLQRSNALMQVFAVFLPPLLPAGHLEDLPEISDINVLFTKCLDCLKNTTRNRKGLIWIKNKYDLFEANNTGKLGVCLSIEDGRILEGSIEKLKLLFDAGVRIITLTWNNENCIGYPNSNNEEEMKLGLKPFGESAISAMNRLGIIIDVSHLSDGGVKEVLNISSKPVMASHSCCRAINAHPRNLSDNLISEISTRGGIIGLNFSPTFLTENCNTDISLVSDMVKHIKHLVHMGGEDCPAIGSDFDGMMGRSQIESPLDMDKLFLELEKSGLCDRIIEKIAWKNAFRFFTDCL